MIFDILKKRDGKGTVTVILIVIGIGLLSIVLIQILRRAGYL
jgi:hypothetical protein